MLNTNDAPEDSTNIYASFLSPQVSSMSLVMAVEAWIMAILGWGVLTLQEMWAWSLLSAHVFYSILCLSTCNLILTGVFPGDVHAFDRCVVFV
jgi:hypothetical protein